MPDKKKRLSIAPTLQGGVAQPAGRRLLRARWHLLGGGLRMKPHHGFDCFEHGFQRRLLSSVCRDWRAWRSRGRRRGRRWRQLFGDGEGMRLAKAKVSAAKQFLTLGDNPVEALAIVAANAIAIRVFGDKPVGLMLERDLGRVGSAGLVKRGGGAAGDDSAI